MAGEVTGESIKSAISLKIKSRFAQTSGEPPISIYPTIYKEKVVQGMEKPCFFIWVVDVTQDKIARGLYTIEYQMNIRYHGQDDDPNAYSTLSDIGHKLLEALVSIDVPILVAEGVEGTKPVYGKQMDFKIVEDVLQVFVTYSIRAREKSAEATNMNLLTLNQK